MTEYDIIQALGYHLYLKYICIPNVLMFGDDRSEYEADFIYFKHTQRFLTEVEAKTNIADFCSFNILVNAINITPEIPCVYLIY